MSSAEEVANFASAPVIELVGSLSQDKEDPAASLDRRRLRAPQAELYDLHVDPSELCILANLLASLQFRTGLVETMHLRADYSSGVCRAIRKAVFASGTPQ